MRSHIQSKTPMDSKSKHTKEYARQSKAFKADLELRGADAIREKREMREAKARELHGGVLEGRKHKSFTLWGLVRSFFDGE